MTAIETAEDLPTAAHVTMVYQGPTAPHWEMQSHFGDQKMIEAFWTRVYARLLLLPKHDPQFRRNRERVNRDAERERIVCDWDLGEGDAETTRTEVVNPADVVEEAELGDASELEASELDASEPDASSDEDAVQEVSSEQDDQDGEDAAGVNEEEE